MELRTLLRLETLFVEEKQRVMDVSTVQLLTRQMDSDDEAR